jgi:hypothetical protein
MTPYTVNFKYINKAGQAAAAELHFSHGSMLKDAASPLDISLVEVPNADAPGTPGKLNLTLNSQGSGTSTPRSDVAGTWPYEVYIAHQKTDGSIDAFAHAAGSHFLQVSAGTGSLAARLDELTPQDDGKTRLLFTLRDSAET